MPAKRPRRHSQIRAAGPKPVAAERSVPRPLAKPKTAAPLAVSLVPVSEPDAPATSWNGVDVFLLAIPAIAALLLGAAAIPTAALRRGELGNVVSHHRSDLALLGFGMILAFGAGYFVLVLGS